MMLDWLSGEEEVLRRRAVLYTIRQEMEMHPAERGECVGEKRETAPVVPGDRSHYWREPK